MEFTLKNSKRNSVALEITPEGTLLVRAPMKYTKAQAEEFIQKNQQWISKHLPSILAKKQEIDRLSDTDIKEAKKAIKLICTDLVKKYSVLMGVSPQNIKITSATKRFGSCSAKNAICFSYYLMLYPYEAIAYVVVHELAHIKHHNHSKSFHKYVQQYLPEAVFYEKLLHPQYALYSNFEENLKKARILL